MRIPSKAILASSLIFLLAPIVYGEILDRIVVVIDGRFIITLSDIRKERAIQSGLGRDAGSDAAILDALVERHLVAEQIKQFREIEVPEAALAERLRNVQVPPDVSREDLRNALIGEFQRNQFMMERFQQFIRVSDD